MHNISQVEDRGAYLAVRSKSGYIFGRGGKPLFNGIFTAVRHYDRELFLSARKVADSIIETAMVYRGLAVVLLRRL